MKSVPGLSALSMRALAGGAAGAGLLLALFTALGPLNAGAPDGDLIVAFADGGGIARGDYEAVVASLAADKRNPVREADKARALETLIAEELLVRRGIELGLAQDEPSARKALVEAMVRAATAGAGAAEPKPGELEAFFDARPMLGAEPAAAHVLAFGLDAGDSPRIAALKARLAAGEDLAIAGPAVGAHKLPLPDAPLTAQKLTDYLGPAGRDAALALQAGEQAGPLITGSAALFLAVRAVAAGVRPPLDAIRPAVLEAWRAQARDAALADYVAGLKRRAGVQPAPDAPRP